MSDYGTIANSIIVIIVGISLTTVAIGYLSQNKTNFLNTFKYLNNLYILEVLIMVKTINIDKFYHTMAKNLMGSRSGCYSLKEVVEKALEDLDDKYPNKLEDSA